VSGSPKSLVSIIIPAHNAGRWLGDTLASIGRQTYTTWELGITDDGSFDDTYAIAAAFQQAHPDKNIRLLRHESAGGQGEARNTAIKATSGEFVAFLDADDLWIEDHLARAVEALRETGSDLVFCPQLVFEDDPTRPHGPYGRDDARWGPFPDCLYVHCYILPSCVIVRRQAIEMIGLFDEDRRVQSAEDLEMWLRLAGRGFRFHQQPVPTCLYRAHPLSVSKNKTRMAETKAWAIWKNRDTVRDVAPRFRHWRAGIVCEEAARSNRCSRPDKAAGYYLMAFRACPRPKYLAFMLACIFFAMFQLRFPPLILKPSAWRA